MKLEREVRKEIINYLNKNKIFHFRIEDQTLANFPDIMIIYKGKAIAIELKRNGKTRARDGQLKVLKDIEVHGGAIAKVVSSVDEVKEIIERLE